MTSKVENFFDKNTPDECAQFLLDCGLSEDMVVGCMARATLQMLQHKLNETCVPDGLEDFAINLNSILQMSKR